MTYQKLHLIGTLLFAFAVSVSAQTRYVTISATGPDSENGIHTYRMSGNGNMSAVSKTDAITASSYHTWHPDMSVLYAVGNNTVYALKMDRRGNLTLINEQPSHGRGPCYVSTDQKGHFVMVANYSGGSISIYPVLADGSLGARLQTIKHEGSSVHEGRQDAAHPHLIISSPDNQHVLVPDLGMDQIFVYQLDPLKGMLKPNPIPFVETDPGAGPRHIEFHPEKPFLFVLNELLSTITSYRWDANLGKLTPIETQNLLPDDFEDTNTSADIHVTADGRFVYASNRGHNSLACFKIMENGTMQLVDRYPSDGERPRNFLITPDDKYILVANRQSNKVVQFSRDMETGTLTKVTEFPDIPQALCIKMKP